MKKRNVILIIAAAWSFMIRAQESCSFEMRYFTHDAKANGVTDFHGETEWLSTEQRVALLDLYANYASRRWGDPNLNTPLFTEKEVEERLSRIKPQPSTTIRQTIDLKEWRAYGYKPGKEKAVADRWQKWTADGARIEGGRLILDKASASPAISPLNWRFRMKGTLDGHSSGLHVVLNGENTAALDISIGSLDNFEIYGDLPNRRVFLSSNGKTVQEQTFPENFGDVVTNFSIGAKEGRASLEHFSFYAFELQPDNKHTPYRMELLYDEDFCEVPKMEGWQRTDYEDTSWETVGLPSPHGGRSEAGEDYYLRTKVRVDDFKTAFLDIEALDPAGEVWVNGEPAAVLKGRIPRRIDVAEYLRPNAENVIAVRVKPYYAHHSMLHTPSDHNIGWFLGRTSLILNNEKCHIDHALVHTVALSDTGAVQHHRVQIMNREADAQKRLLQVNYYPWFPEDGRLVASVTRQVELRPTEENIVEIDLSLKDPNLWSPESPRLYRVEFLLKDENGKPTDDLVTTTGIRLVEQREGVLYVNHKPQMLNGAQNFGYRLPLETISKTVRCGTNQMVMRDLMMAKELGNLLRLHVHAEGYVTEGINDPRFAQYADQLGLYLIWQTGSWTREGEAWNADIKNYPNYIRQVYNHPSITIWEAGNHPNHFRKHDASDSQAYFSQIIQIIAGVDTSRLISPTSHWAVSHFANYDGTRDYEGKALAPNPWLMHRKVTRGSQDAYSGYGSKWSSLRHIPNDWARSCLDAKDLCYFNYEHEESVAQPNWSLSRKEPWFEVKSYEWDYFKGSIGRELEIGEWRASQAYQAFSAWESMKMQTLAGVSGYSWCSLESGPNMFTYMKPLIDPFCVPKLAFYANKMAFQSIWAGSDDVDTVYGPGDSIRPVIFNLAEDCTVTLIVELQNEKGKTLEKKTFRNVQVPAGRSVSRLEEFRFRNHSEGCRFIVYKIFKNK